MGLSSSKLDTSKDVKIIIKPDFIMLNKNKDFIPYDSNKKECLLSFEKYLQSIKFKKEYDYIFYGLKYQVKSIKKMVINVRISDEISLNSLKEKIRDGLWKITHSGDPVFIKKIGKNKVFVLIKNIEVKQ